MECTKTAGRVRGAAVQKGRSGNPAAAVSDAATRRPSPPRRCPRGRVVSTTHRRDFAADSLQMARIAIINSIHDCGRRTIKDAAKRSGVGCSPVLEMRAEDHQREELEQYLGADHCGV